MTSPRQPLPHTGRARSIMSKSICGSVGSACGSGPRGVPNEPQYPSGRAPGRAYRDRDTMAAAEYLSIGPLWLLCAPAGACPPGPWHAGCVPGACERAALVVVMGAIAETDSGTG